MMFVTPSDTYTINVEKEYLTIDVLDINGNDCEILPMVVSNLSTGEWKLCKISEDIIIFAKDNFFKELLNYHKIQIMFANQPTITCNSMEEAMFIKDELVKEKESFDDSAAFVDTLECILSEPVEGNFVVLKPNSDEEPKNLSFEEKDKIIEAITSPYGIPNITSLDVNSLFLKMFKEGSEIEIYNSFIDEVVAIRFIKARKQNNIFDIFNSVEPKMKFIN